MAINSTIGKRSSQDESSGEVLHSNKKMRPEDAPEEPHEAPSSNRVEWLRDSTFYYEDGSVVLLVEDVLFKVHASLLKAQSEVFQDMFTMPLVSSNKQSEGTTDQQPVMVPEVKASEFRSLLKMIYLPYARLGSPRSDKLFAAADGSPTDLSNAWMRFNFYSDVARLAHRFAMLDIEEWAKGRLKSSTVTCSGGDSLVHMKTQLEGAMPGNLLDVLTYATLISDTPMQHTIRGIIHLYSILKPVSPPTALLAAMRNPGLRETQPALFGHWFSLLLTRKHEAWHQEPFTREDRAALFSTWYYLTPLPSSLSQDFVTPLFTRPTLAESGSLCVLSDRTCSNDCLHRISKAWQNAFSLEHYERMASRQAGESIRGLALLPLLRNNFNRLGCTFSTCQNDCDTKVLRLLDEDLCLLFHRVANYYKNIV